MKKLLLVLAAVLASACASERNVCGRTVPVYGVVDDELKQEGVEYRISPRNAILGLVFSETLLIPGITVFWYLWEPVPNQKCQSGVKP